LTNINVYADDMHFYKLLLRSCGIPGYRVLIAGFRHFYVFMKTVRSASHQTKIQMRQAQRQPQSLKPEFPVNSNTKRKPVFH